MIIDSCAREAMQAFEKCLREARKIESLEDYQQFQLALEMSKELVRNEYRVGLLSEITDLETDESNDRFDQVEEGVLINERKDDFFKERGMDAFIDGYSKSFFYDTDEIVECISGDEIEARSASGYREYGQELAFKTNERDKEIVIGLIGYKGRLYIKYYVEDLVTKEKTTVDLIPAYEGDTVGD